MPPPLGRLLTNAPAFSRLPVAVLAVGTIVAATLIVAILEQATTIADASAVYLVAVVIVGSVGGTAAAVGTAIGAFLAYDLLFTAPRFSLAVADTSELLNLTLVLIVALAVGRLAALGRERAEEADRRATESTGLFAVSRLLATAERTESVAGSIVERLARDTGLERVWIGLEGGSRDRILADTGTGPLPESAIVTTLLRTPGDEPARWIRAHGATHRPAATTRSSSDGDVMRVRIETGGTVFGSLLAVKPAGSSAPNPEATRLLALAADQIALGLRRDRLRHEATSAEIARRSDALKSALLDSVSHDLRTPLASIRATAGNLADPALDWSRAEVREAAETIDDEARRLDRFVGSVLDLSRIESGALRADLEVFDLPELIERAVTRVRPVLGERPIAMDLHPRLPLARVDAVLFDAIVANILDNVAAHTPTGASVAIRAGRAEPGRIRITIEDGGPGVPDADLVGIFEKFRRGQPSGEGARRGMGIGLSIVRGMAEANGGSVSARRSELGGLAIDLDLLAAPEPPAEGAS
ncbi:MAG: two-component system, OmpR family, sensor histidine kinase KdpD [Chloroflexota bacterium]|nr:two-component system, OmpR family, sensor histidine kinase KdpD [Chloroflexota bacterium]